MFMVMHDIIEMLLKVVLKHNNPHHIPQNCLQKM